MIISKDNENLTLIRKLSQKKHRRKLGMFVTEGEDLALAGLKAGHEPVTMLVHPDSEIPGEKIEPTLLDTVATLASGTRVIGVWPEIWAETELITADNCLFLDGISDPGNIGTIIRTADALIGGTVVLGAGSADPFSGIAVRASMGSIFTQPVVKGTVYDTPEPRFALALGGSEAPGPVEGPVTLCFGSEREGLSENVLNQCGTTWTIPQRPGGAQSLNVAAAAAIACERIASQPGGQPN